MELVFLFYSMDHSPSEWWSLFLARLEFAFVLARQVLYHFSHTPSSFCFIIF
jgi:hypothetical protein